MKHYLNSKRGPFVTAVVEQTKIIREMPEKTKVTAEHRITGSAVGMLLSVLSLFASFQLWTSKSALHHSDIKIRKVRLLYPQVWLDIDSFYNNNPKERRIWV